MECGAVRERLGEFIDGEVGPDVAAEVGAHLRGCVLCRSEARRLREMVEALRWEAAPSPPEDLWARIERAAGDRGAGAVRPRWGPTRRRFVWSAGALAACLLGGAGTVWVASVLAPAEAVTAGVLDFRPLLARAGRDIAGGLEALLSVYGGRRIDLSEAQRRMRVRVHPAENLPGGLRVAGLYLVNMGDHESLTFHLSGGGQDVLVMQCPPGMRKAYGERECLPCQVGGRPGQIVREGACRLVHLESENVCVCIVSTLDERHDLPALVEALHIEF